MAAHSVGTSAIPTVAWDQPETGWPQWLRDMAQSINLMSGWVGTATGPGSGGGGGTVTSISAGTGIAVSPSPITLTGSISLDNMAANSLKGNNTGSAAAPIDLTVAQAQTLLSVPAPSSTTPSTVGTAAIGTGTTYARADHVHGAQTVALTGGVTGSGTTSIAATVVQLQGRALAATAPTTNQVIGWNGSTWLPVTPTTLSITLPVSIANGGTGVTTAAAAPWVEVAGDTMTGNLTVTGITRSTGAAGALAFDDRTAGAAKSWVWYADVGAARLYSTEMGADRFAVTTDGGATFQGGGRLAAAYGGGSGDANVTVGQQRTADGNAYVDFFAQAGGSQSARLLRGPGVNGALYLVNYGLGPTVLQIAGGYNGQMISSAGDTTFYARICVGTSTPGGLVGSAGAINSHSQYIDGVLIHGAPRLIDAALAAGEPLPFTGLDPDPPEGETVLSLLVNRGGQISLQRVVLGPVDGDGMHALMVSGTAAGRTGRRAPEGWGVPVSAGRHRR